MLILIILINIRCSTLLNIHETPMPVVSEAISINSNLPQTSRMRRSTVCTRPTI